MKKIKFYIGILAIICTWLSQLHTPVQAYASTITKQYFLDGSYIETELIYENTLRTTMNGAKKRSTYKNASGEALWYGEVNANFYFDGKSSKCTSATVSAGSYNNLWKIKSKQVSKSGNSALGTVIGSSYTTTGVLIGNKTLNITLSCDKNGKIS